MFHNHATPRRIYITTDKLCSNKLLRASTHAARVRLLWPSTVASTSTWLMHLMVELHARKMELQMASASALNVFNCYWLPEFPRNSLPIETSTCQRWQMQVHVGCGTGKIGFSPCDTIFRSSWQRLSSGDWLQSLHCRRNTTYPCHEVASFCCVKLAEITMVINLY
jgi:hypothetical protein